MPQLKPRSATVVIYQGDDLEVLADLRRKVEIAKRHAEAASMTARAGDDDESVKAAEANYDAAVDDAAERALVIELRHIGKRRWRDLLVAHPPREVEGEDGKKVTHEDDAGFEVNTETFPDALVSFIDGDVRTIHALSDETPSPGRLRDLLDDELAEGDFERVWHTAFWLNKAPGGDPAMGKFSTGTAT